MDQRAQNRIDELKKLAAKNKLQSIIAVNKEQKAEDSLKAGDPLNSTPKDFLSDLNALQKQNQ